MHTMWSFSVGLWCVIVAAGRSPERPPGNVVHPHARGDAAGTADNGALQVRGADGTWRTWWRADDAPAHWRAAHGMLAAQIAWRSVGPGVETGELALSGPGEAWRVRAVLVRLDPAQQRLALHAAVSSAGSIEPWDVARAPADAVVAFNAGMFDDRGRPWGWVVHNGREVQPPAVGPLSMAVVVREDGRVHLVGSDEVMPLRDRMERGEVAEAIQAYPTLLRDDGVVPASLRHGTTGGVDRQHRDARLFIGELRDGRILLGLTRFDALRAVTNDLLGAVPFGLTVPEVSALAGALGCRRAVLLDGGISAQLLVRDAGGRPRVWSGLRRVPLGIVSRTSPRP